MKTLKTHKSLLATAVGAALAVGMLSQAYASPVFTVTPTGPTAIGSFQADFIAGNSSELLIGNTFIGDTTLGTTLSTGANQGWLNFSGFSLAGAPILPLTSGLGVDFQLYVLFSLVATYTGNSILGNGFGQAGSNYNVTTQNYTMYLDRFSDAGGNTTFTQANATSNTPASVTDFSTNDIVIGSGSVIPGSLSVAGFSGGFGAFLNSLVSFTLTTGAGYNGDDFFTAPVPFYNIAFDAFNNTTQGVIVNNSTNGCSINAPCISVTNAIGGIDYVQVPEPETLALLGIGLLGMGVSLRKRKAA